MDGKRPNHPGTRRHRRAARTVAGLAALTVAGATLAGTTPSASAAVPHPAAAAVATGDHTVTLTHAGKRRTALVHVPRGYDGSSPLPTLLHFPGLYETPALAELFDRHAKHADDNGYLMVIPAHHGVGWQGVPGGSATPDVDDPGFVRALLDTVVRQYHADPRRLYASGLSNGGFFTHKTACVLSDRFAAYAAVSGQLPTALAPTCAPGRPLPMLMIHGTQDPVVPYDDADAPVAAAAAFWVRNNGCATTRSSTDLPDTVRDHTTVIRHEWQQCPNDAPVVLYDVVGGGHTWPGGIPFLPPPALGWHTYDISANSVIWDFVSRFTLP